MAGGNTIGSVYVRVKPRVKNFRRETEDELRRELTKPIEVDVKVKLNEEGLKDMERELDKQLKPIQRKATIKFDADYDGIGRAMDRVKRQLKDMERQEIEFTANADGLNKALDELGRRKDDSVATVQFSADESSYNDLLRKIDSIRRERRTVDFEFDTDEASLSRVEADARRKLEQMKAWEPIEFRYTDDLEGNRALIARIEQLKRERVEIPVDLNVSDSQLNQILGQAIGRSRSMEIRPRVDPLAAVFAEGTLATLARDRWVELKPRIQARAMASVAGAFAAIAGLNTVGDLVRQIEQIALNFDEVTVAATSMGAAIGSAVSVGTVGLGALLSIAGDTLQVFQGLAMAPTLMLTTASVLQTWKAIWSDFGAALMGIPGVLESMPPNAQRAVGAIEELNEAVNQSVQDNFWGEMTDEVERFTDEIGPHVVAAMGNVATVMGRSISQMIDYTSKLAEDGSLDKFTKNNTDLMLELGEAATTTYKALIDMGIRGSQYLPQLGRWINTLADDFAGFMDEALRTGRFDLWIKNSINSIQSLGQFAKGTWDMLAGITRAFESVGGKGLHEMADGMERVANFVNSAGFQGKLERIFRAAMDGASSVGIGFSDLMSQLYEMDAFLGDLLRRTGTLAGDFMTQLSKAISSQPLQDGLLDAFDGMIDFVNRAGPGFESIANIFGRLGSIGGEVAREIAHGMNLTMGAIDGFIERIQGPLINAIHPLTRVFEDIAALGTPVLFGLANTLGVVLNLFAALPVPIQNTVTLLALLGRAGVLTSLHTAIQAIGTNMARVRGTVALQTAAIGGSFNRMQATISARMAMIRASVGAGFSGLVGALGGPWGIAITAGVGALTAFAGASAEAKARQAELKSSLDEATGAFTDQSAAIVLRDMNAEFGFMEKRIRQATSALRDDFTSAFRTPSANMSEMAQTLGLGMDDIISAMEAGGSTAEDFAGDLNHLFIMALKGFPDEFLQDEAERIGFAGGAVDNLGDKLRSAGPLVDYLNTSMSTMGEASAEAAERARAGMQDYVTTINGVTELPPKMQLVQDALRGIGDESSSAEQRASALLDTLKLLAGGELDAGELERKSTETIHRAMEELERIASNNDFEFGKAFLNGAINNTTMEGVELHKIVDGFQQGFAEQLTASHMKLKAGEITQIEFDDILAESKAAWQKMGQDQADALGLNEAQAEAFMNSWNSIEFDEKSLNIAFNGEETFEQVEKDFQRFRELGDNLTEQEFTARFDADGDGFITELEYATGLGEAFTRAAWQADISGDDTRWREVAEAALAEGYLWDGQSFQATLGADGQPTAEGIALARELGYTWDGERYTALADLDSEGAVAGFLEAANQGLIWDGTTFISTLDADGQPTTDALEAARALGIEWDGEKWVASVEQDGAEIASASISHARAVALGLEGVYTATLQETGGDIVAANAAVAAAAADTVYGPRIATFGQNGAENVTNRSSTASSAADKVGGKRTAQLGESGSGTVTSRSNAASSAADKVQGSRTATLSAVDNASSIISRAVGWLSSFKSKSITLTTTRVSNFGTGSSSKFADGGIQGLGSGLQGLPSGRKVHAYAGGGFENHQAQITSPTAPIRVWSEPETGGEAYIPMSSTKRTRSLAIWSEVGRRFGVFNNGGVTGEPGATSPGVNVNVTNHYPRAEPASRTVNDGLDYAALLGFS